MITRERMIRTIALRDVVEGRDPEYRERVVRREYSRRFNTPLREVDNLPYDHVAQHVWEARYEELFDAANGAPDEVRTRQAIDDMIRERRILSSTPEQLIEARREEEAEDAEAMEFLRREKAKEDEEAAREAAQAPLVSPEDLPPDLTIEFPSDLDMFGEVPALTGMAD